MAISAGDGGGGEFWRVGDLSGREERAYHLSALQRVIWGMEVKKLV